MPGGAYQRPPGRRVGRMKKLVALLFGLLVVVAGFAAATMWRVTEVKGYNEDPSHGWSMTRVGVKYDAQHPYINYDITYRLHDGGAYNGHRVAWIERHDYIDGASTIVHFEDEYAIQSSAGWPYI